MTEEELREKIAEELYNICAEEAMRLINEFEIRVREPRPWKNIPDVPGKEYWRARARSFAETLSVAGYKIEEVNKMLEAKDTVKNFFLPAAEQAEITWAIAFEEGKKARTKEIVEWLGIYENELGFCEISNHIPYADLQAQLKKWGIDGGAK